MTLIGLGLGGHVLARLLEFQLLPLARHEAREPDQELPDVELPDAERRAAVSRELSRRLPEARP